jgi:hypothetical protein
MQPFRYEDHCAHCHPLSVQLVGEFKGPNQDKLNEAVRKFNSQPAPHREPTVVRAALRERLLSFVQDYPVVLGDREDRLIDRELLRRSGGWMPSDAEWRWTRERLTTFEQRLFFTQQQLDNSEQVLLQNRGGCRFCHSEAKRERGGVEPAGLPVFEPVFFRNGRARWMPHARFHHERHRMLECTECHNAKESSRTSDLLMPRLETCQKCHNETVGARHDCAECHTYHDRSLRIDSHKRKTIDEWLTP